MTKKLYDAPDSGIQISPCPHCNATYSADRESQVRIVEPTRIQGKDHPAKGVLISQGYIYCKGCGTRGAMARTTVEVVANWNKLVDKTV